MKLYIYSLWSDEFSCSEIDVDEKPKTYIVTNESKFGYKGQRIRKADIGKLSGYNGDTVILTEKGKKKAVEMFIGRQKRIVENCRKRLECEENCLAIIEAELDKE